MPVVAYNEGTIYAKNKYKAEKKVLEVAKERSPFGSNEGLKKTLDKSKVTVEPIPSFDTIKNYKDRDEKFGWNYTVLTRSTY